MISLNIETATDICSAALTSGSEVISVYRSKEGNHAKFLPLYVEQLLENAKKEKLKIDAVALSSGPGSYTGLRIATATAKGLCYGLNIPLIAIDSLQVLAAAAKSSADGESLLCPMIDARRMEVYCAVYNCELVRLTDVEAKIIDENSFQSLLEERKLVFFGNGAEKCKSVITHSNACFIDQIELDAACMGLLAEQAFEEQRFEDIAYFEPFYLKQYNAIKSQNKVLTNL